MKKLTIFYDARCGLCSGFRKWLEAEPKRVEIEFLDYASDEGKARLPHADGIDAAREIIVMADDGRWWQGESAWVMCLWITYRYQDCANRFASPLLKPLIRKVVILISEHRFTLSRLLSLKSDQECAAVIESVAVKPSDGDSCSL